MALTEGRDKAVAIIEGAFKKAQENSQGADNLKIIAESVVDAFIGLMPNAEVTGITATQIGLQKLTKGKIT